MSHQYKTKRNGTFRTVIQCRLSYCKWTVQHGFIDPVLDMKTSIFMKTSQKTLVFVADLSQRHRHQLGLEVIRFATNVNRFWTSTLTLTSFLITSKRAVYSIVECWFWIVASVAVIVCCWFLHGCRGSVVGYWLLIVGCRSVFPLFVPCCAYKSDIFNTHELTVHTRRWFSEFYCFV